METSINIERFDDEPRGRPRWVSPRLPPNLVLHNMLKKNLTLIYNILRIIYNIIFYCTLCEICLFFIQITFIATSLFILAFFV